MRPDHLRILFLHSGSDLYGASRSLLRLSSRLARDGAVVQAVLPGEGPLGPALRSAGVDVIIRTDLAVLERARIRSAVGLAGLIVRVLTSTIGLCILVRRFRPHVMHTITAAVLPAGLVAWLMRVPHVWHVRESFAEFGNLWTVYQRYLLDTASVVICVSTAVAEQFAVKAESEKVRVIHNGFPIDEFEPVTPERIHNFKTAFGLAGASALVGVVGRIKFRRKGQEVFVEAASLLREFHPDARFVCVGSPFPGNESHLERLRTLIHDRGLEGYVLCLGDAEDIKAAISALDILVLPSVQAEPFGGVVVEAMALSRPVVATRTGGSLEQVDDGVTGLLAPPDDAEALAAAIGQLLASAALRREFGANGRKRFEDCFEFEPFYAQILSVYNSVVSAKEMA